MEKVDFETYLRNYTRMLKIVAKEEKENAEYWKGAVTSAELILDTFLSKKGK